MQMICMKGAELPINTLIIIVIAIAILLAIIAIFYNIYNPSKQGITTETAKNNACQMLASLGCSVDTNTIQISDFDADKDGNDGADETGSRVLDWSITALCPQAADPGDNLASLCHCYYGMTSESDCKTKVCRCSEWC